MDDEKENLIYQSMTEVQARKLLDVGPYATTHDTRAAYKRKAMGCYPKELINPPDVLTTFRDISVAYKRLVHDFDIDNDQVKLEEEHEFKLFRVMFEDERHVVHVHTEQGSFLVLGRRTSPKQNSKHESDDDFDASQYSFQKQNGGDIAIDGSESTGAKPKTDKKKLKKQRQRENKRQAKENLQKQREEIKQERQKLAEEMKVEQPKKVENESPVKDATSTLPEETKAKSEPQKQKEDDQSGKIRDTTNRTKSQKVKKSKSVEKKLNGGKEKVALKESGNKARKEIKVTVESRNKQEGFEKQGTGKAEKPTSSNIANGQKNTESKPQELKKLEFQAVQSHEVFPTNPTKSTDSPKPPPPPDLSNKKDISLDEYESGEEAGLPDAKDIDVECAFFAKSVKTVQKKTASRNSGKVAVNCSQTKENAASVPQKQAEDRTTEIVHQLATEANLKAGQERYNEAAALFTRAILLDVTNFLLYANRSFCYEQLSEFEKALYDAERAISFYPQWPKGHFRKGRALVGLKKYKDAENSFEQVLRLDETNHDADNELYHARVKRLEEIGFSKQQSVLAIRKYITVDEALEKMLAGNLSEAAVEDVYVSDDEDLVTAVPELADLSLRANHVQAAPALDNVTPVNASNNGHIRIHSHESVQIAEVQSLPNARGSSGTLLHSSGESELSRQENKNSQTISGKIQPKKAQYYAVWIGNITRQITETILNAYFIKFGPIRCVKMHYDRQYAFVNYVNSESASLTLQAHTELELHGQHLFLSFPGQRYIPNRAREPALHSRAPRDYDVQQSEGRMYPRGGDVLPHYSQVHAKVPINDLRKECTYWRRSGCIHGPGCKFLHIPAHQGIDNM